MKWYRPSEQPPPAPAKNSWSGPPFLGVFRDIDNNEPFFYFVTQRVNPRSKKTIYVEASGEQYMWWKQNELIAWATIEEVKKDLFTSKSGLFY